MAEKHYCGRCGRRFTPKPYYYGGADLCDSCRDKQSDNIDAAKKAYDGAGGSRSLGESFSSMVSDHLPNRKTVRSCPRCGCSTNGDYCSSCKSKIKTEEKKQEREAEKEQKRLRKALNRMR